MNEENIIKKQKSYSFKRLVLIILLLITVIIFSATSTFALVVLNSGNVYTGVKVGAYNVGDLSYSELCKKLTDYYKEDGVNEPIVLKAGDSQETIQLKDLNITYDVKNVADEAYNIGRSGNVLQRLREIIETNINGKALNVHISYNKDIIDKKINDLYSKVLEQVKEHRWSIEKDKVRILSGHPGSTIDKSKAVEKVRESIYSGKAGIIEFEVIKTPPAKIDADQVYKKVFRQVKDASIKTTGGKFAIESHVEGRDIDKQALSRIVTDLDSNRDKEYILPVTIIKPGKTKDEVESLLFKDILGSAGTAFLNDTDVNKRRTINIKNAVAAINGTVVLPGGSFSFNKTVGPRTPQRGYQKAFVYYPDGMKEDYGGGICQVSSTLHLATVQADFDVLERHNHMYTVHYVVLGTDAAVSEGSDFSFKNNTNWPAKIFCSIKNNWVYFTIQGTDEYPDKEVSLMPVMLGSIPFSQNVINDPTLEQGKTIVLQSGLNGYNYDTYKIVKQKGVEISREKVYSSYYTPYNQRVKRGAKSVPGKAAAPTTTKVPTQAVKGPTPSVKPGNTQQKPAKSPAPSPVIEG